MKQRSTLLFFVATMIIAACASPPADDVKVDGVVKTKISPRDSDSVPAIPLPPIDLYENPYSDEAYDYMNQCMLTHGNPDCSGDYLYESDAGTDEEQESALAPGIYAAGGTGQPGGPPAPAEEEDAGTNENND